MACSSAGSRLRSLCTLVAWGSTFLEPFQDYYEYDIDELLYL
jgi:hypothetical protein